MSLHAITLLCVRFDTAPGGKVPAHEWIGVFRCIIGSLQWINRKIAQPMGRSTKIRVLRMDPYFSFSLLHYRYLSVI